MRIMILGGDGTLGHQVLAELGAIHEVAVTLHHSPERYRAMGLAAAARCYYGVDAVCIDTISQAVDSFAPQVVLNAIGLIKQRDDANERLIALEINAMLPHRLAELCRKRQTRLIHISTDCVFSGRRGNYGEDDLADAEDVYGRTKFLGEVSDPPCLTLRTSIIGRELSRRQGLLEWVLAQRGIVRGYTRAVFSGLTTNEFSRVLRLVIERYPQAYGLYHVASQPIAKYALLQLLKRELDLPIDIIPDATVVVNRSLDGRRFRDTFGYRAPSWTQMVAELRNSPPRSRTVT